jgi:lycopene beta-cyclase
VKPRNYDVVFVGGGLAAMLLMRELGSALSGRVAVIDPTLPSERPTVHWSYWSRARTPYDEFSIGAWRQARTADRPTESIAPFTLRLVRSREVFAHLAEHLRSLGAEWIRTSARTVAGREDGRYDIATDDAGTLRARWVFDSVCDIEPAFPSPRRPRAVVSGTGLRVHADRPVFDPATATLLDPIDERSFAYLLPLGPAEALLESASFGPDVQEEDETPLLRYLRTRYPDAGFDVAHAEYGEIPLGFPPPRTTGPRHVLLGNNRGLVKPSAGYGVARIARETEHLARLWRRQRPLPPSRRARWWWRLLDMGFVQLAARDPRLPLELMRRVMSEMPISLSLRFIDEELPLRHLATIVRVASPVMARKP